jgi:tetraacyldisaccharide 4'-kinase
LLTDFHNLYNQDYIVPSGSLREFRSGAKRADIIIVTKCAKVLSPLTRTRINEELKPLSHQKLYFSYIEHGAFKAVSGLNFIPDQKKKYSTILLFAGIANSYPLEFYLKNHCIDLEIMKFPDHHNYTIKDVTRIVETYDALFSQNKIIVTTEKDAMRLSHPEIIKILKHYPVCYVPIKIKFHKEDKIKFDNQIIRYVKKNSRDD